jgi:chromosome segregation ATPase
MASNLAYNVNCGGERMDKELLNAISELLEEKLEPIRSQQQEDHAIIKALMHASEVEKAEIDGIKWTVARIEGRLTMVEDRLTGVEERLTMVEGRLTGVEERLTMVEGRLTGVEERLAVVESEIKELHDGQERIEIVLDRVEADVKDIKEGQRVLCDMYGEHEMQIRELRKKVASA